jgi:hypothetical protein
MCKFGSVRLKDDLETLLSCCFDLNYVNIWYLMSMINLVYVLMLDLPQLFNDWYKRDVMYCILDWIRVFLCHMYMMPIEIGMLVGIWLYVIENMVYGLTMRIMMLTKICGVNDDVCSWWRCYLWWWWVCWWFVCLL